MLNRLNKRYRSCIDCVMRQRKYRQTHDNNNDISNNINNHGVLAILDKDEDETFNIEPSTNLIDYPHIEPKQEPCFPIEPNIDISNFLILNILLNQIINQRKIIMLYLFNFLSHPILMLGFVLCLVPRNGISVSI